MNRGLLAALDRGDELVSDLLKEYEECLKKEIITPRAEQLTHEVAQTLRSGLDRTARLYWEQEVKQNLSPVDQERAKIYFPIAKDEHSFDSILGRWMWRADRQNHASFCAALRGYQPYSSPDNAWLTILDDISTAGKHINLLPQKRSEEVISTVTRGNAGVRWNSGVRFSGGISIMGAPIDPETQRIKPTPGVSQKTEKWVLFIIEKHNVNAASFSRDSATKCRAIVEALSKDFNLL